MMPRFWPMFRKEFVQMRRDRLTLGIMIGVPILQLLLFGFAIQTDVRNIPTVVLDHRDKATFPTRDEYDKALVRVLKERQVRVVCLAGFMRLLTQTFLNEFPNAVVNIHPSLLPAFPGTNAQYQAL